jgi:hydrogenase maturation protein HypF
VYRIANAAGVAGRVLNHTAGVTIDAFGPASRLDAFLNTLASAAPDAAHIDEILTEPIPFEPVTGFEIVESETRAERRVSIPPDLPLCADCARELRDPGNRRHDYAFTNCTSCGPRFTIATAAPYDRPNTTMVGFRMCEACQREYDSMEDRRFHAQPNACPACGPRLSVVDADGSRLDAPDPLDAAAAALLQGRIVALKGIGGFHLACDATSGDAVAELRRRKRRDEKPFAVMARDLRTAQRLCVLAEEEERLLLSVERPIVLVDRREPSPLSPAVAPRNPLVGIFLPYSPLHQLLLDRVDRPLVMTSGNVSDEPLAYTDEEALQHLGGIADLFLVHNREIVTRCDDSVARVVAGAPMVLRRSRGYVPRPVRLARPVAEPVLACGALLKNTFCLARGGEAYLGPHIGDLENLETYRAYCESIARLERFLEFTPAIVAHDLHPEYLSTGYAIARHRAMVIGVQHHHAHIASLMAEHALDGPVIGVAYDGTGLGTDGAAWGGEILVAGYSRFERVGTFRPIPLPGGDAAIRQPWRTALALVDDAFAGDPPIESLPLFQQVPRADLDLVLQMIRQDVNAPKAHGVGRYFDAFGAIGLGRAVATYEGQVALEWNVAASGDERGRYRYEIDRTPPMCVLDLRPAVRDAVFELIGGEPACRISARFHNTLAAATVDLVRCVGHTFGHLPVALSGGCFQNRRLTESVLAGLAPDFAAYVHRSVPPGDGGLALGQAVVADALAKGI